MRGQPLRRFAFKLCAVLGWPHPDYLLAVLTPEQFAEWAEFNSIEPLGPSAGFEVEDARTALLASVIARAAGADVKPEDFSMNAPPPVPDAAAEFWALMEREFGPGADVDDDGGVSELERAFGRGAGSPSK